MVETGYTVNKVNQTEVIPMAYTPQVTIDALKRMKESEYGFDMQNWCTMPDGRHIGAIEAVTRTVERQYIYVPAPSGTVFCFAGFLSMFEIQRLSEASDSGMFNIGTVFTENLALNSIGLGYNYHNQGAIETQFQSIFFKKSIKTINGLQRVLKREGLLQPV